MLQSNMLINKRYRLQKKLGQGGMAEVWRAQDEKMGRSVAIKLLHAHHNDDNQWLERFRREARAVAKLNSPLIVQAYDIGEDMVTMRTFIVMEFVEGETLGDLLRAAAPLPLSQALTLLRDIATGVGVAHQAGLIHRDLKPSNIMLSKKDEVKITDFGIVHDLSEEQITDTDKVWGTAHYMSPEQAQAFPISPASDIYALGVLLFEMLTGQVPFPGQNRTAVALAHIQEQPPYIRSLNPSVPRGVAGLVDEMLAKVPRERPPDGAALVQRLDSLLKAIAASEVGTRQERKVSTQTDTTEVKVNALMDMGNQFVQQGNIPAALDVYRHAQTLISAENPLAQTLTLLVQQLTDAISLDSNKRPSSAKTMRARLNAQPSAPQRAATTIVVPAKGSTNAPVSTLISSQMPIWALVAVAVMLLVLIVGGLAITSRGNGGSEQAAVATIEHPATPPVAIVTNSPSPTKIASEIPALTETATLLPTETATLLPTETATEIPIPTETEILPPTETATPELPSETVTPEPPIATATLSLPVLEGTPLPEALSPISAANAGQVAQIARWGKGWSPTAAYFPDGKWLAVATWAAIYLYDAQTQEQIRVIEAKSPMNSVAISADGSTLASGDDDANVRLWRVSDGSLINSLEGHTSRVNSVAISPDGTTLASGSWDETVRLWRVSDGSLLHTLEGHTDDVSSVAISPDGTIVASSSDGTVRLWRVSDGSLIHTLEGHISEVDIVAISPDGTTLTSSSSQEVRLWRVSDGSLLNSLEHTDYISSLAISPDGTTLASSSWDDKTVQLWRVSDGGLINSLEGYTHPVFSVAISPDGTILASGSRDGRVRLWRVFNGSLISTLEGHASNVESVAISLDGTLLASGSADDTVRLWRVSDGNVINSLEGHTDSVTSVAINPDGTILASGSGDNTVRLWRVSDGRLIHSLAGHTGYVRSVAISPDGTLLVSGSDDGTVRLWRVSDGSLIHTLEEHTDWVPSVAISPSILASGSSDNTVRLWRVSDGSLINSLEHTSSVWSVAITLDGTLLASGDDNGIVQLWRVSDGSLINTLEGHTDRVYSMAISLDGTTLASGSFDGTVRLWRVVGE